MKDESENFAGFITNIRDLRRPGEGRIRWHITVKGLRYNL